MLKNIDSITIQDSTVTILSNEETVIIPNILNIIGNIRNVLISPIVGIEQYSRKGATIYRLFTKRACLTFIGLEQ